MLRFIKRSIKAVPYFADLRNNDPTLYNIIYSLETQKRAKGEILQRAGADADELYFLESGIIEVYTVFEEKEFVIERLFKGSILNYRTFFMEEKGVVNLRFGVASVLKSLSRTKMESICEVDNKLNTVF